jgi:hypothetical protein
MHCPDICLERLKITWGVSAQVRYSNLTGPKYNSRMLPYANRTVISPLRKEGDDFTARATPTIPTVLQQCSAGQQCMHVLWKQHCAAIHAHRIPSGLLVTRGQYSVERCSRTNVKVCLKGLGKSTAAARKLVDDKLWRGRLLLRLEVNIIFLKPASS